MSTTPVMAEAPYYVLLDGNQRIGPKVVTSPSGIICATIYGFSNKVPYDKFLLNSQQALTPYPLVRGFLREQATESSDELKLVVVDAVGPRAPCVQAATMKAVLLAHENRSTQVVAEYQLTFDPKADAYRLDEPSA